MNKKVKTEITKELSQWSSFTGNFEAEKYDGSPLLDTNIEIHIKDISITWSEKENLMEEISEVLKKYII